MAEHLIPVLFFLGIPCVAITLACLLNEGKWPWTLWGEWQAQRIKERLGEEWETSGTHKSGANVQVKVSYLPWQQKESAEVIDKARQFFKDL